MNFLRNIESNLKGEYKKTEKRLENGVIKTVDRFESSFVKEEIIDGMKYRFDLGQIKGVGKWHLSFSTDNGMLLTNRGLAVYKKIVDNIVILINTARKNEKVKEIYFFGVNEEMRINEIEEFKNFLKTKLENSKNVLDNFSYVKEKDDLKKSLYIRNGEVFVDISGERLPTIKERIKKENMKWEHSSKFSVDEFLDNQDELVEILKDKEMLSSLMKHINADFFPGRNVENKDTGKLRTDLYERTLKQRFSGYKFERKGQEIKLYLK